MLHAEIHHICEVCGRDAPTGKSYQEANRLAREQGRETILGTCPEHTKQAYRALEHHSAQKGQGL